MFAAVAALVVLGRGPLVAWTGEQSGVTTPGYRVVANSQTWAELWRQHARSKGEHEDAPEIAFRDVFVLAVFSGKTKNNAGYRVIDFARQSDALEVRLRPLYYSTIGGARDTTSYAFFVLPRPAKDVVVVQDVRSMKTDPPKWEVRARLTVPDAPSG